MDADYVEMRPTWYGGRGVFSRRFIPKGTTIHRCTEPYASIIYRSFRKEVCALCFTYAYDSDLREWKIRGQDGEGVWFCSEECKANWESRPGCELARLLNSAIDKACRSKSKPLQSEIPSWLEALHLESLTMDSIDQLGIDTAWQTAEKALRASKESPSPLDDDEADIARFAASALVQRYLENQSEPVAPSSESALTQPLSWSQLTHLQDNELPAIRARPYLLRTHILVYAFLYRVITRSTSQDVKKLAPYVQSPETIRGLFAREHGNAFGLWELNKTEDGDSEMFGYGVYASASFFNHDCTPNTSKTRIGRGYQFSTMKDVSEGEELCITYISLGDDSSTRRRNLKESWYFDCACTRCKLEIVMSGGSYRSIA